VNAILFPEDFRDVMEKAATERASIESVELRDMGFTHAESGRILAELWRLPVEIANVIEYHMHPEEQAPPNDVTHIVSVADQICRRCGLDYGYEIEGEKPFAHLECWQELSRQFPAAGSYSEADATALLEHFVAEARALADEVISPALVR